MQERTYWDSFQILRGIGFDNLARPDFALTAEIIEALEHCDLRERIEARREGKKFCRSSILMRLAWELYNAWREIFSTTSQQPTELVGTWVDLPISEFWSSRQDLLVDYGIAPQDVEVYIRAAHPKIFQLDLPETVRARPDDPFPGSPGLSGARVPKNPLPKNFPPGLARFDRSKRNGRASSR